MAIRLGVQFSNALWRPVSLASVVHRIILPALNRGRHCSGAEIGKEEDTRIFEGRASACVAWMACSTAWIGSNLNRLGVTPQVIQAILRHSDVSTTVTYYVKMQAQDVQKAMEALEASLEAAHGTRTVRGGDGIPTVGSCSDDQCEAGGSVG